MDFHCNDGWLRPFAIIIIHIKRFDLQAWCRKCVTDATFWRYKKTLIASAFFRLIHKRRELRTRCWGPCTMFGPLCRRKRDSFRFCRRPKCIVPDKPTDQFLFHLTPSTHHHKMGGGAGDATKNRAENFDSRRG